MIAPPLPGWVRVGALASVAFLVVPVLGLLVRLPWADIPRLLSTTTASDALSLSLATCTAATVVSAVLGLPLALVLARGPGRLTLALRTLTALPMVLPPVVAGLALLITLGRRGVLGQHLAVLGVEVGFTSVAVVIAQAFVAMPYFVVTVESALRTSDPAFEAVAAQLGATPTTALRRVTLPLLAPALVGGASMAFARALGEFGATLTFAGSLQGTTRTLPLEIYLQREADTDAALALALVLIVVALVLMSGSSWLVARAGVSRG
ncbi:MAG: ABC transporter permease [Actinomycetes bacterium]